MSRSTISNDEYNPGELHKNIIISHGITRLHNCIWTYDSDFLWLKFGKQILITRDKFVNCLVLHNTVSYRVVILATEGLYKF